jgi:tetratricopeptide (TPR) repeat protein
MMGDLKINTAEYDTALVYFERVYAIANELVDDTLIGFSFQNKGSVWFETGRLNEAYDAFYKASIIFLKLSDSVSYAQSVMNMSQVLWQWDQNDEAIEKLQTMIGIAERHQQLEILSKAYSNLGLIYYYDEDNYSLAMDYFSKALKIREKRGYSIPIANILVNIANVHVAQNQFQDAFSNFDRALKIYESTNAIQGIVRTHFHLGEAYHKNKEYQLSNQNLEKCLSKAKEFDIISYNSIATDLLMQNYIALNDFASFLTYFKTYKIEKDSLEDAFNQFQAKEAKFRLLSEELQQLSDSASAENEKLNQKLMTYNYLTAAVIGLIMFSIVMLLIIRSVRKAHRKPLHDVV